MIPSLAIVSPLLKAVSVCLVNEWSPLTDLYYEPVNLIDRPPLPVAGIMRDFFADMLSFVVEFAADHAIAKSTASLFEDDTSSTDRLNPIHDQSLNYSELPIQTSVNS